MGNKPKRRRQGEPKPMANPQIPAAHTPTVVDYYREKMSSAFSEAAHWKGVAETALQENRLFKLELAELKSGQPPSPIELAHEAGRRAEADALTEFMNSSSGGNGIDKGGESLDNEVDEPSLEEVAD